MAAIPQLAAAGRLLIAGRFAPGVRPAERWPAALRRWAAALLLLGAAWRLLRYALQFPIWEDEAYLCLNFIDQDYLGFLDGLKHNQVAPLLFLWIELAVYHTLGGSELALRLLPALAGLAALPLFWKLARRTLTPLGSTLAVGIFAVSYFLVRHACEVKPYSLDLLLSVAFLLLAASYLSRNVNSPRETRFPTPLHWLCLLVVPALGLSNPVVFVAGGVSLALVPSLVRRRDRQAWLLWGVYNFLLVGSFLGYLQIQMRMQSADSMAFLREYWADAFPPADPLAFVRWLLRVHAGRLMAYPVGGNYGTSALTLLLFLAGAVWCWRSGRRQLLLLCLAPFALTFVAACLHRYPYGFSARVSQHLAPAICLLAGAGLGWWIERVTRSTAGQKRFAIACLALLVVIGLGGIVIDLFVPFKNEEYRLGREHARTIAADIDPATPLLLLNREAEMQWEIVWYLHQYHPNLYWKHLLDWERLEAENDRLALLYLSWNTKLKEPLYLPFPPRRSGWKVERWQVLSRPILYPRGTTEYFNVAHWHRSPADR